MHRLMQCIFDAAKGTWGKLGASMAIGSLVGLWVLMNRSDLDLPKAITIAGAAGLGLVGGVLLTLNDWRKVRKR